MTTPIEAAEAIYARFEALFPAAVTPTVVHTYENEKFDEPVGGANGEPAAPWVRLSIRTDVRGQETLGPEGGRKFATNARVLVQIFTALDTGRQKGDTIGRAVLTIFEGKSFSALNFTNGLVRESGVFNGWQQHTADVQFAYYETK